MIRFIIGSFAIVAIAVLGFVISGDGWETINEGNVTIKERKSFGAVVERLYYLNGKLLIRSYEGPGYQLVYEDFQVEDE